MKKIRTRLFKKVLYTSLGIGASFLLWMLLFGKSLAAAHFDGVVGGVFAFLGLAALTFLGVCFVPFFRGDKRWYAIPSWLTVVFFVGSAILWQVPVSGLVG